MLRLWKLTRHAGACLQVLSCKICCSPAPLPLPGDRPTGLGEALRALTPYRGQRHWCLGVGAFSIPRPLHHCCCRAGEGGQGEAQVPRPAAAGSAPSPPLSSAPARTALACACDEGAGDGERLLSHRRRHNPPQSRRCEKAPRRCAAPPLLQQTGGRVGTKMNDARLRARSVLGEGRCANGRRRPLGLLASMLHSCELTGALMLASGQQRGWGG